MNTRTLYTIALLPAVLLSGGSGGEERIAGETARDNYGNCRHAPAFPLLWVHEFVNSEEEEEIAVAEPASSDSHTTTAATAHSETERVIDYPLGHGHSHLSSARDDDDDHGEEYTGDLEGEWTNMGSFYCHVVKPFFQHYDPHCSEHGVTIGKCTSHKAAGNENLQLALGARNTPASRGSPSTMRY